MKPSIIIATSQSMHNEWMAFACWYSIHRTLPDCKVAVVFPRSDKHYQFTWLNKCQVPYLTYGLDSSEEQAINMLISHGIIFSPIVILKDHMMVIREPDFSNLQLDQVIPAETLFDYSTCTAEKPMAIIDYSICGKFALAEWVKKEKRHPFNRMSQIMPRNRTVNEQRVFQLWRQMEIFDFLNRV